MDKTCPECNGKKGKWQHTHSSLNPTYPHIFIDCQTCKGAGRIPGDKIRTEFEEWCLNYHGCNFELNRKQNSEYESYHTQTLWDCYRSRDEGIKKMKDAARAYQKLTICYRLGKPPSEKLHKQLNEADQLLSKKS